MARAPSFVQRLGYAMVGGLLLSQALTLFTTPVISISTRSGQRVACRRKSLHVETAAQNA
jgi:Cu/Ag efflux pump CusA